MGAPNLASGVAMRMSQQARGPVALVGEAVLGGLEDLELADVGAGHEGLAAGAAQDEDAHGIVGIHLLADLEQPLVHGPGHGVAGLRPIEGERHDRSVSGDERVRGVQGFVRG